MQLNNVPMEKGCYTDTVYHKYKKHKGIITLNFRKNKNGQFSNSFVTIFYNASAIRDYLEKVHIPAAAVSCRGVPAWLIQKLGRWCSGCYKIYIPDLRAFSLALYIILFISGIFYILLSVVYSRNLLMFI